MTERLQHRPLTATEAAPLFAHMEGLGLVLVAVSGGSDSLCLMRLLADWSQAGPKRPAVHAATVDHGLRFEASAEAERVADWAGAVGLRHSVLRDPPGPAPRTGVQAYARELRYRLLMDLAVRRGAGALVLAHTLEDQAETLVMRLARGSGVTGLAAMSARSERGGVPLFRPLLGVARERLRATLRQMGQDWIEDPGNADPRFERVRTRQSLAPGGGLARAGLAPVALARSAFRLTRAESALATFAARAQGRLVRFDRAGFARIDAPGLAGEPEEIALRVLAGAVAATGRRGSPAGVRLEAALARLAAGSANLTLAGCRIFADRDTWLVTREARGLQTTRLQPDRSVVWDQRLHVGLVGARRALEIRALGAAGLARARALAPELGEIPAAAGRVLPGGFAGDDLLAPPAFEARSRHPWLRIAFSAPDMATERRG